MLLTSPRSQGLTMFLYSIVLAKENTVAPTWNCAYRRIIVSNWDMISGAGFLMWLCICRQFPQTREINNTAAKQVFLHVNCL